MSDVAHGPLVTIVKILLTAVEKNYCLRAVLLWFFDSGRKDLMLSLCFIIMLILLDRFWSTILRKLVYNQQNCYNIGLLPFKSCTEDKHFNFFTLHFRSIGVHTP